MLRGGGKHGGGEDAGDVAGAVVDQAEVGDGGGAEVGEAGAGLRPQAVPGAPRQKLAVGAAGAPVGGDDAADGLRPTPHDHVAARDLKRQGFLEGISKQGKGMVQTGGGAGSKMVGGPGAGAGSGGGPGRGAVAARRRGAGAVPGPGGGGGGCAGCCWASPIFPVPFLQSRLRFDRNPDHKEGVN